MKQLEAKELRYIGGLAKNRKVLVQGENSQEAKEIRLDELAESLEQDAFTAIQLKVEKARTVWVASLEVELSTMSD